MVGMNKRAVGELGERIASAFLAVKGYEILEKNIRYARREIDILARDGGTLVAVEVKLRRGRRFGKAATGWRSTQDYGPMRCCRVDREATPAM